MDPCGIHHLPVGIYVELQWMHMESMWEWNGAKGPDHEKTQKMSEIIFASGGSPWIHVGPISSLLEPMWDPCENGMDPMKPQGDESGPKSIPGGICVGSPWIHVGSISSLLESM